MIGLDDRTPVRAPGARAGKIGGILLITLRADLHTHTVASGHAYGTAREMIDAAAEKELELIALTDHAPNMPGSCGPLHFTNLGALPRRVGGVTVLRGVELNALDLAGSLDLPEGILNRLDWVIASIHTNVLPMREGTDCTGLYLALAENPMIDMIGHPDTPACPFDMERVIPTLARRGKAIELNEQHAFDFGPQGEENARRIVEICARCGAFVAVNSDAHSCWDVGRSARSIAMLEEMAFPEELVLNVSARRVLDFVRARRPNLDV